MENDYLKAMNDICVIFANILVKDIIKRLDELLLEKALN